MLHGVYGALHRAGEHYLDHLYVLQKPDSLLQQQTLHDGHHVLGVVRAALLLLVARHEALVLLHQVVLEDEELGRDLLHRSGREHLRLDLLPVRAPLLG